MNKIIFALPLIAVTTWSHASFAQEPSFYDCQNRSVRVNIPSMPLGEAVARFTQITRCPVSIDADEVANTDVREVPTFAVKGKLTPRKALGKMLSSSPLKVKAIKGGFSIYQN